jgi:21S rRNA (GM2251-2'-O)-methyltransferase
MASHDPCRLLGSLRPRLPAAGNEGAGLRTNVRRACTALVRIDMAGPHADGAAAAGGRQLAGLVDSLNVSVATGIMLQSLLAAARPASGGG